MKGLYEDNPVARKQWQMAQECCHCCGIDENQQRRASPDCSRWPYGLWTHHLIRIGRSDEPANYLSVCTLCHDLAHGARKPLRSAAGGQESRSYLPVLALGQQLWLKRQVCASEWDPERLAKLFGKALPDLERPAAWFFSEWSRWRPWMAHRFF